MTPDLRTLLLQSNSFTDRPLFVSAAALAEAIAQRSETQFSNASTVATILSGVFRGQRACSEELEGALLSAAEHQLLKRKQPANPSYLLAVRQEIQRINTTFRTRGSTLSDRLKVPDSVPELFRRIARRKGLCAVEYRDYPRAYPEGEYKRIGADAGLAVAQGACFAMFQPFANSFDEPKGKIHFHTLEVRNYLRNLAKLVEGAFYHILSTALDNAPPNQTSLDVAKRIMLYRRGIPPDLECLPYLASGIQSRTFYVEIPSKGEEKADQEVWEWVATGDEMDDLFVPRSDDSIPKQVMREQFFPVVRFWKESGRLLHSDEEITQAIALWNGEAGANLPPKFWEVFLTPEKALDEVRERKERYERLNKLAS